MQQDKNGYSFIELLIIVVVVVMIICEIVIPNFSQSRIEDSRIPTEGLAQNLCKTARNAL